MNLPPMKGFTIEEAECWWIACDACGETTLVFGTTADVEASTFASEHVQECPG